MNKPSDTVYKMLAFQYKPLEKKLLEFAPPYIIKKYEKLPTTKKIMVLDKFAYQLGL